VALRDSVKTAVFPNSYGVYVLYETIDDDQPLYVGVAGAQTIAERWRRQHLRHRSGGSALRRSLGVYLGLVEQKLRMSEGRYYPHEVEDAISAFLADCLIEFFPTSTTEAADDVEVELRQALRPRLNVSQARRRRIS
jgi:hypothetical protein